MVNLGVILVVDDEEPNRRLMKAILEPLGYSVCTAADGAEALDVVKACSPDCILMDAMMPRMGGLEAAAILKASEETRIIPVIMVTGLRDTENKVKAFQAGVDEFLAKPFDKVELQARIASLLKVKAYNEQKRRYEKELESEVEKRTRQLKDAHELLRSSSLEMIYRLSRTAELRDRHTGAHLKRMSQYSAAVARCLRLPAQVVDTILYASPMHDVGKIGIPDRILLKPGRLDDGETEVMRMHTTIGAQLLHGSTEGFLRLGEVIALTHHERWDGQGYPRGLSGNRVPLAGYIVAIADVFDALTSKRPYKEAFDEDRAFTAIRAGREAQFHPEVCDAFFTIATEISAIRKEHAGSDETIPDVGKEAGDAASG